MKKTVLITGAGSGIGRDTAFELCQRGHSVIATTETEEQAGQLRADVEKRQLKMDVFKLDVTDAKDRALVAKHELDVLINNAAIGETGSIAEIDMDKVRNNFEVNVFSAFALSQLVLPSMFEKNSGTVIFISSLAGRIPITFMGPYSMTKFALSSGAETLRKEVHMVRKNVHISLVEPGGYHTGFNQRNMAKKFEWMDEGSVFGPILKSIKADEERIFKLVESKNIRSIVKKIVGATEAQRPRLRYSAPGYQKFGVWLLRAMGK